MAEYHIGCGIAGIYAGTLNKNKTMFVNKSDVTDEALFSVGEYLLKNKARVEFNHDGKRYAITVSEVEE